MWSYGRLTDQQITNVFAALLGIAPRAADLAVLRVMKPDGVTVKALAEYLWDHRMGEPDEPTLVQGQGGTVLTVVKQGGQP